MANKHFTTNAVIRSHGDTERLRRMMERIEQEATRELLLRVQTIKSNLDRKAGR